MMKSYHNTGISDETQIAVVVWLQWSNQVRKCNTGFYNSLRLGTNIVYINTEVTFRDNIFATSQVTFQRSSLNIYWIFERVTCINFELESFYWQTSADVNVDHTYITECTKLSTRIRIRDIYIHHHKWVMPRCASSPLFQTEKRPFQQDHS